MRYLLFVLVLVAYFSENEAKVIDANRKTRSNITDEVGETRGWDDDDSNTCKNLPVVLARVPVAFKLRDEDYKERKASQKLNEDEKEPNIKNIVVEGIIKGCGDDYDAEDRTFPFLLMKKLTSTHMNIDKKDDFGKQKPTEEIWLKYEGNDENADDFDKYRVLKRFSLRHFTKTDDKDGGAPTYKAAEPNFSLLKNRGLKIENTNTKTMDYTDIGNPAFTFWLFCVDGKAPYRNFLGSTTHYADLPLDKASLTQLGLQDVEFFASNDLMCIYYYLGELKPRLIRGKLQDLVPLMFTKAKISPKDADKKSPEELLIAIEKLLETGVGFSEREAEFKIAGSIKVDGNVLKWKEKSNEDDVVKLKIKERRSMNSSEGRQCPGRSNTSNFRYEEKRYSAGVKNHSHVLELNEFKGVLKHKIAHAGVLNHNIAHTGVSKHKIAHAGVSKHKIMHPDSSTTVPLP